MKRAPGTDAPLAVTVRPLAGAVGTLLVARVTGDLGWPAAALSLQWRRGNAAIPGATRQRYRAVRKDNTRTLSVAVTAKNSSGSVAFASRPVPIGPADRAPGTNAPIVAILGPLTGAVSFGVELSVQVLGDMGYPAAVPAIVWQRDGDVVEGATGPRFKPALAGSYTAVVTASNGSGIQTALSNASVIAATAPRTPGTLAPLAVSVSPATGTVGANFTATISGDLGDPAATPTIEWLLGGAVVGTGSSYTAAASGALSARVRAANGSGSTSATSAAATVTPIPRAPGTNAPITVTLEPALGDVGATFTARVSGDFGYPQAAPAG